MLTHLLDLIWPRTCAVCGKPVDRPARYVCADCLNRLPFVPTDGLCRRCGRDVPELTGEFICEECRTYKPAFDRAASALRFDREARRMLLDFKFNHALWLRDDFVDLLEAAARARFRLDALAGVVAVPSVVWHRFNRGFNPAEELARALAKRLGVALWKGALRRCGLPKRQGGLSEAARRTNVVGTVAVTRRGRRRLCAVPRDKVVLIVDDVMTTGSTLSECARILKQAGVSNVWALTLTRSLRY